MSLAARCWSSALVMKPAKPSACSWHMRLPHRLYVHSSKCRAWLQTTSTVFKWCSSSIKLCPEVLQKVTSRGLLGCLDGAQTSPTTPGAGTRLHNSGSFRFDRLRFQMCAHVRGVPWRYTLPRFGFSDPFRRTVIGFVVLCPCFAEPSHDPLASKCSNSMAHKIYDALEFVRGKARIWCFASWR